MIIAQITDCHIVPDGAAWKDWSVSDTQGRLIQVCNYIGQMKRLPDILLVSGDITEHGDLASYQKFRNVIDKLGIDYYVVPGNHDNLANLRQAFLDHIYLPKTGPFQYEIDQYPLRIIGIDSNYPDDKAGLDQIRLNEIQKLLKKDQDKPTLLLMHHHPIATGLQSKEKPNFAGIEELHALVKPAKNIVGIVCGHYHSALVGKFADKICYISPSVAPLYRIASDTGSAEAIEQSPPGFSIHYWDHLSFNLLSKPIYLPRTDIEHFIFPIRENFKVD